MKHAKLQVQQLLLPVAAGLVGAMFWCPPVQFCHVVPLLPAVHSLLAASSFPGLAAAVKIWTFAHRMHASCT